MENDKNAGRDTLFDLGFMGYMRYTKETGKERVYLR